MIDIVSGKRMYAPSDVQRYFSKPVPRNQACCFLAERIGLCKTLGLFQTEERVMDFLQTYRLKSVIEGLLDGLIKAGVLQEVAGETYQWNIQFEPLLDKAVEIYKKRRGEFPEKMPRWCLVDVERENLNFFETKKVMDEWCKDQRAKRGDIHFIIAEGY